MDHLQKIPYSLPNGRDAFQVMFLDDFLIGNGKEAVEGPEAVSG